MLQHGMPHTVDAEMGHVSTVHIVCVHNGHQSQHHHVTTVVTDDTVQYRLAVLVVGMFPVQLLQWNSHCSTVATAALP
jgi:hypothetical protein